jgi:hypothetical protein
MFRNFHLFLTHFEAICYVYIWGKHSQASVRCQCRCCTGLHVTRDSHLNGIFVVEGCLQILKRIQKIASILGQ